MIAASSLSKLAGFAATTASTSAAVGQRSSFFAGRTLVSRPAVQCHARTSMSSESSDKKVDPYFGVGVWIPGLVRPDHLDGSLPADYGFDPLGLSVQETVKNRLVEGEVINGRWAMLAVVGAIAPEFLGRGNFGDVAASQPFGSTILGLEPIGVPAEWPGLAVLFAIGAAESLRLRAEITKGYGSYEDVSSFLYPGFDPLGLAKGKSADEVKVWRTKEIKNGRLAMIAFIGFVWQYIVTGAGPLTNLSQHLADPHANWFFSGSQL